MSIRRRIHNLIHPKLGAILMLHGVLENRSVDPTWRRLEITPEYLAQTVGKFCRDGVDIISIGEVANRLQNRVKKPFVCLTFDDGYLNTFSVAYPILRERQVPFCVYMTRDYYRGLACPRWDEKAEMMGVDEVIALSRDPLCTLGCHTCTHPRLGSLAFEKQMDEIAQCKSDLEILVGSPIQHLAYPHGDYNQETLEIARQLGFSTAVTTSGLPVRTDARLLELDRVTLIQPD